MLKAERLQMEGQLSIPDAPLVWQIKKFPFPSAFVAAVVMTVQMLPFLPFLLGVPDDLGIGAEKDIASPALQFFSTGGIDHFIILPVICNPHEFGSFQTYFAISINDNRGRKGKMQHEI